MTLPWLLDLFLAVGVEHLLLGLQTPNMWRATSVWDSTVP